MVYPRENLIISYFQLFLLLLLLLTTITSGDEFIDNDRLVTVRCQKNDSKVSENYTRNVDYVVAHIINISKEDHGFKNAMYSSNESSTDTVYSLVQCRGDLTDANCSTCLSNIASINMSAFCPDNNYTKGALVVREKCLFKYSDQDFFGKLDVELDQSFSPFCSFDYNVNNGTDQVKYLLDSLHKETNSTKKMYAIGSNTTTNIGTVEAIAECRRDLAVADCNNCLTNATTNLVDNCHGKTAGKYFLASCNVRFAWNGSNVNN